jgi:hypothetical protein
MHLRSLQAIDPRHGARGLRRPQRTAGATGRRAVALPGGEARCRPPCQGAAGRAPRPPVGGVREHRDKATGRQPLLQEAREEPAAFRLRLFLAPTPTRCALTAGQGRVGRQGRVRRAARRSAARPQVLDKLGRLCSKAARLPVGAARLGRGRPADQRFAIVTARRTARPAEGPGGESTPHPGEPPEVPRAGGDRLRGALLPRLPRHRLPPARGEPCQRAPRCGAVVPPTARQPYCPPPALGAHKGAGLFQGRIGPGGGL